MDENGRPEAPESQLGNVVLEYDEGEVTYGHESRWTVG